MAPPASAADRRRLSTVAALMAKAEGSPFGAEQHALALRAYTELAAYLNSVESKSPGARRRERRLLDRRGRGSAESPTESPGAAASPPPNGATSRPGGAPRNPGSAGGPDRATDPPVIDLQVLQARTAYRAVPRPTPTGVRVNVGL